MNDEKFRVEVVGYWREVFRDLIHWYDVADSKSLGIITINGIMLSFITLGSFIGGADTVATIYSKHTGAFYILLLFLFSVLLSVILAVYSLWGRIKFDANILLSWLRLQNKMKCNDKENNADHSKKDYPETFFSYIADSYPTDEHNRKRQGINYFDEQMSKYTSNEQLMKGMAVEIPILSSNLKKKYRLVNLSFIFVIASLVLMSVFIILLRQ